MGGEGVEPLVERAVGGDDVALKVLLAETRARLCRFLSLKIPPELTRLLDPDDIVQETHVEVFRRIRAFQPHGLDSFFRWTATIALNRVRNALAMHRAQKRGGGRMIFSPPSRNVADSMVALLDMLAGPGKTPSRTLARMEAASAVKAALEELPTQHREAVWLVHIEGQSAVEAAAKLGKTDQAVRGLCRRGLKLLEQHLQSASKFLSSSG